MGECELFNVTADGPFADAEFRRQILNGIAPPLAQQIDPEYMNYLFRDLSMVQQYETSSRGIGTIQRNIFAPWLLNCWAVLPSLGEQKRIANYLNKVCTEIDALTADIQSQIDTLEQYKRSVVFRTVSQGITHAAMKKTDSNVWTTIPSNWDLADIKYLFEIVKRIAGKEGYDILSVTQRGLKVKDISSNEGQIANDYSGYQLVYPTDFVMNHMDLLTGPVTEHIGTVGAVLHRYAAPGRPGRLGKTVIQRECGLFAFLFIKCVV